MPVPSHGPHGPRSIAKKVRACARGPDGAGSRGDGARAWPATRQGLRGVGKPSDEVPAEPVGQYSLVEVGHLVIRHFAQRGDNRRQPAVRHCLKAGTTVLRHDGKPFDAASIGSVIATRAVMEDLRAGMDGVGGGPPPFNKARRSNVLQALDRVLVKIG